MTNLIIYEYMCALEKHKQYAKQRKKTHASILMACRLYALHYTLPF